MTDWKEKAIIEYHTLERARQMTEEEMAKNPSLCKLIGEKRYIEEQIVEQEREYREDIRNCDWEMQKIRDDLIEQWDVEGKSYKCNEGNATLRTTKSLVIADNLALIDRLAEILNNKQKAFDCIRTFDLSTIRKYMDVDLIDGNIAHYDEKRNVVISGIKKGGDSRDEE